ncbi:VCBS repeat-containing protein [Chitinophagales bacterium]|nr:VCBS repeat-containing protein [Chitinophagales bacterium]
MKLTAIWAVIGALLFVSCQQESEQGQGEQKKNTSATKQEIGSDQKQFGSSFKQLTAQESGVSFNNEIVESPEWHFLDFEAIYNGAGVGVGDLDNDGFPDLVFGGNQVEDEIYWNKGDATFEQSDSSAIGEKDTWTTGVALFDINGDNLLDIYLCRSYKGMDDEFVEKRRNRLWINKGNRTFEEKAKEFGLDDLGFSTQACPVDYDLDGDLDIYLVNNLSNSYKQKALYQKTGVGKGLHDKLYKNNGRLPFTEVSREKSVRSTAYALGVAAGDFNRDGFPDLYTANDYEHPDLFFINEKGKGFKNEVKRSFKHLSFYSMGCDAADVNNDGLLDLAVLDMQAADHYRSKTNMPSMSNERFWTIVEAGYHYQYMNNVLQINNDFGFYTEVAQFAGMAKTDWSWSVLLADFDNDGWKDCFVSNGIKKDIRNSDFMEMIKKERKKIGYTEKLFDLAQGVSGLPMKNYLFDNSGNGLRFDDVSEASGLATAGYSHGAAIGDLDGDGDLDLVTNNSGSVAGIYLNSNSEGNNSIRIKPVYAMKNKSGIGTTATIYSNGEKQFTNLYPVRGYLSCSEPVLHFGIGQATAVDSIEVVFPDGRSWKKKDLAAGEHIVNRKEVNSSRDRLPLVKSKMKDFTEGSSLVFQHKENEFDDFEREILLPHKLSSDGPAMATGDWNGDGIDDVFLGGAASFSSRLYRSSEMDFSAETNDIQKSDAAYEDVAACFVDIDGDGAKDLYVVSGGSEESAGHELYQDRLYFNRSRKMVKADMALGASNGSCVKATDFDNDGDMDLFVGGQSVPGKYPKAAESYLLVNENGQLVNKAAELAPELSRIGMVRDAEWADVDGDGDQDLMLVGEWMEPSLFINNDGVLELDKSAQFSGLSGWWFHVARADLDQDGDIDFIVGNIGQNNKFGVSAKKPLRVYASDFDGNNTNDIVLSKLSGATEVPLRGRECSSEQMPFVAQKFESYNEFASASLPDIYGDEKLESSVHYEATEFRSGILINDGAGQFSFQAFPDEAQLGPVLGTGLVDLDNDNDPDIVLAGNLYDAEVETTRHDGGNGITLVNEGNNKFSVLPVKQSGFYTPFNAKDVAVIRNHPKIPYIVLVANNDFYLQVMRPRGDAE